MAPTEVDFGPTLAKCAPDQMSAYFLDLEGALSRIDSATTYYQVLGVDRTDGHERIKSSFQHLLNLLFPAYAIGRDMPAEVAQRIERGFQKASQAFGVLASFAKRKEYDSALISAGNKPPGVAAPILSQVNQPKNVGSGRAGRIDSPAGAAESDLTLGRMPQRGLAYSESFTAKSSSNRRRCERFKLSLPVRVTGHDRQSGKWHEMAETVDVSRTGARLRLRTAVTQGMVLYITLPLPAKLRAHGFAEQSYNVYTLVRRVEPPKAGVRAVGVEFIGERPPAGYLEKPWSVFRPKGWGNGDRRRPERKDQTEKVKIEYFDENMHSISRGEARTENVSRYGLRICGTTSPRDFNLIKVTCPRLKFEGMAALRSRFVGKDGLERISVHLIEKEWPSEG